MRIRAGICLFATCLIGASPAVAEEIWIAPTHQSNTEPPVLLGTWPATGFGVARFAFALPDGLQTVTSAKVLVIREGSSGAVYSAYACSGQHASSISGVCNSSLNVPFTGAVQSLRELDVTSVVSSLAAPPAKYMSLLFWTSTATTDRVVGLRLSYAGVVEATTANTRLGTGALIANSSGTANTAIGANALLVNDSGFQNTAIGHDVMRQNDVGIGNTGVGALALRSNTDGGSNVAIGMGSMEQNSNGSFNTAVGTGSLRKNGEGAANTAIGGVALGNMSIGEENTAVGWGALSALTIGFNNIGIGNQAGLGNTNGSGNIYIGSPGVAGESSTIRIGDRLKTFIGGIAGVPILAPSLGVVVSGEGQLGILPSSARFKTNVADISSGDALQKLRPVSFAYQGASTDAPAAQRLGLIAEEVAEVLPTVVGRDRDGTPLTVDYVQLIPLLIEEVQRLTRRLETLEGQRRR